MIHILLLMKLYHRRVNIVGAESRYEKIMKTSETMKLAELGELMGIKNIHTDVYCCYDNVVRSCNPETEDDDHCNTICLMHPCVKGGFCKVFGKKHPKHRCHCYC